MTGPTQLPTGNSAAAPATQHRASPEDILPSTSAGGEFSSRLADALNGQRGTPDQTERASQSEDRIGQQHPSTMRRPSSHFQHLTARRVKSDHLAEPTRSSRAAKPEDNGQNSTPSPTPVQDTPKANSGMEDEANQDTPADDKPDPTKTAEVKTNDFSLLACLPLALSPLPSPPQARAGAAATPSRAYPEPAAVNLEEDSGPGVLGLVGRSESAATPANSTAAQLATELKPAPQAQREPPDSALPLAQYAGTKPDKNLDPPDPNADSAAKSTSLSADGTSAAPQGVHVKQAVNQDEIAALPPKLLPEQKAQTSQSQVLPLAGARTTFLDVASEQASSLISGPEDPPGPSASRLLQTINHEVASLRRSHSDSLAVVLKPDSQTEILLQLQVRGDKIEASARCERGDFQLLSTHWSELRQSLERQGVHLLDLSQPASLKLADASNASMHFGDFSRRNNDLPSGTEQAEAAFGANRRKPIKPTNPINATPAAKSNHLLESWA